MAQNSENDVSDNTPAAAQLNEQRAKKQQVIRQALEMASSLTPADYSPGEIYAPETWADVRPQRREFLNFLRAHSSNGHLWWFLNPIGEKTARWAPLIEIYYNLVKILPWSFDFNVTRFDVKCCFISPPNFAQTGLPPEFRQALQAVRAKVWCKVYGPSQIALAAAQRRNRRAKGTPEIPPELLEIIFCQFMPEPDEAEYDEHI